MITCTRVSPRFALCTKSRSCGNGNMPSPALSAAPKMSSSKLSTSVAGRAARSSVRMISVRMSKHSGANSYTIRGKVNICWSKLLHNTGRGEYLYVVPPSPAVPPATQSA